MICCVSLLDHDRSVDDVDRRIVDLLRRHGRSTYQDIGRAVGLSAPAAKRRVDRLVEDGVIVGFTALVDHARLGTPLQAVTELRFAGNTTVDEIASIGDGIPQVIGVFTTAGDPDALAWLRVRDVTELKRVIDRLRSRGMVTGTKTMIILGGPHDAVL
jgi:DNA-binding Lrp family transcriptional regulator